MATFQVQQRIYGQGTWLIGQMYRWQLALRVSAVLGRSWGLRCRVGGRDPSPSWISPKTKMFLFSQNANGVVTSFAKVLAPVLPLEPINCKLKRGEKFNKKIGIGKIGRLQTQTLKWQYHKMSKSPTMPFEKAPTLEGSWRREVCARWQGCERWSCKKDRWSQPVSSSPSQFWSSS